VPAARQRYSEGAIDFLNIVSTQALLLQSENDLADSDARVVVNLVNLYRASKTVFGCVFALAVLLFRKDLR
jgi:outer membrane protein TolC